MPPKQINYYVLNNVNKNVKEGDFRCYALKNVKIFLR